MVPIDRRMSDEFTMSDQALEKIRKQKRDQEILADYNKRKSEAINFLTQANLPPFIALRKAAELIGQEEAEALQRGLSKKE